MHRELETEMRSLKKEQSEVYCSGHAGTESTGRWPLLNMVLMLLPKLPGDAITTFFAAEAMKMLHTSIVSNHERTAVASMKIWSEPPKQASQKTTLSMATPALFVGLSLPLRAPRPERNFVK